jgi:transcriptional regulator with GAF, ATPase, and Fis domain
VSCIAYAPDGSAHSVTLLPGERYLVGRGPSADIVLDHPGVAAEHAVLHVGENVELEDCGTGASTLIGGEAVAPGARVSAPADAVISFGSVTLVFQRASSRPSGAHKRAEPRPARTSVAPGSRRGRPETTPLVLRDPKTKALYEFAKHVAASEVSVLILGETGAGKELMARAIHEHSRRRSARLVTLNCAAIPESLVESELFGYERGAFSGAVTAKPGLFEIADGSTLFLDEVGELPRTVQAKLLRVLETGEVPRLGSVRAVRVDVRIVAATNRDVQAEISAGNFRADLFYRLNGMTVTIPPLRERPEDILALAEYFAQRCSRGAPVVFEADALQTLKAYAWPGNVRELKSVVERAVILSQGQPINHSRLMFDPPRWGDALAGPPSQGSPLSGAQPSPQTYAVAPGLGSTATVGPAFGAFAEPVAAPGGYASTASASPSNAGNAAGSAFAPQEMPTGAVAAKLEAELVRREKRRIREALDRAGGNQKDAAKLLGISRRTLINRLERYGIARPRKRRDDAVDE